MTVEWKSYAVGPTDENVAAILELHRDVSRIDLSVDRHGWEARVCYWSGARCEATGRGLAASAALMEAMRKAGLKMPGLKEGA